MLGIPRQCSDGQGVQCEMPRDGAKDYVDPEKMPGLHRIPSTVPVLGSQGKQAP